jgi:multidrug resistance protein, MATE family
MMLYLMVFKPFAKGTWAGWTCDSVSIIGSYMKLAIPGALMGCLEWWSFEIVGMAAGSLGSAGLCFPCRCIVATILLACAGDLSLATHNILANTVPFMFMIPLGISVSASTMIGNLLGASDPHSAHKVSVCARIAIVTLAAIYSTTFLLARNYVPHVRCF